MKGFVTPLGSKESLSSQIVGTKASNLASMMGKDIPVPPGFCITTNAYNTFLDEHGLFQRIASLIKDVDRANPRLVGSVTETIHNELKNAEIPSYIIDEVNYAFDELQKKTGIIDLRVAVRSSAIGEDLVGASFAGQYETFLNIKKNELLQAVKECWLSLWSIKGILYREKKGIAHRTSVMGVLVQAMIPAEASGVVFTASPTGKDDGLVWINAGYGLGEGVVSGRVNSDVYRVDKKTLEIVYKEIRKKDTAFYPSSAGIEERPVSAEVAENAVLSDDKIKELAGLSLNVEAVGQPSWLSSTCFSDIEWAYFNKKFYILQVRPICDKNTEVRGQRSGVREIQDARYKMQDARLSSVTLSELCSLVEQGNISKAKEVMATGSVTGVSISNIHKIIEMYNKAGSRVKGQGSKELEHCIKVFYANLFKGGIEDVNFMKLSAYLPKLWDMELKDETLEGIEYILKTGNGFGGATLADIMRYALPMIEKDLPYAKPEWLKMRVINTLSDGDGMEDASISEVLSIGQKLIEKNINWLNDAAKNGMKRILQNNLKPIGFDDIKRYVLPCLMDKSSLLETCRDKFQFKDDLKEGVINLLSQGKLKTNLADVHIGLKILKEQGQGSRVKGHNLEQIEQFEQSNASIGSSSSKSSSRSLPLTPDLKDALTKGLKISLNKKSIYKIGGIKDEGIIYASFKPIAYLLREIGNAELEAVFYKNAGALLEESLKGIDADDSILAFKEVLLLASEYTRDRRLESARRNFIGKVYKSLPGASIMGVDWQSLHNDFEEITDVVPPDLKRFAVDLRDSFHNTLDPQNLTKALNLLNELKTNFPECTKAIKLAEGIAYWLDKAYRPQVKQIEDSKKISEIWDEQFKERFKELVSLYNGFISIYEKGRLIDAVVSHSKIRAYIGKLLLDPSLHILQEDRLTLYLTDINLERLEQGFSSIVNERFTALSGLADLYKLSHWINALLYSASRYLPEIEDNLYLAERFTDVLKEEEFYKAREIWCRLKKLVSSLTESRQVLSLVLFDVPAERIDSFFFTVSPIAAGKAEGYIRIFERAGDERLARVLNDPLKGIKQDEIIVIEYLPEIAELKIFPKAFIVEKGSVGSHTAKVAVEFGIPTVRMEGATKRFKEGERVFVKVSPSLDTAEAGPVVYERIAVPKGYLTPFYHGKAEGIVSIYQGDVEFLKPPSKREVVALSFLDTKYLDIFAEGDGPCAIIVEKGGELTHPMLVAREMLTRLKRTMPILRLENVFEILKHGAAVKIIIPEDLRMAEVWRAEF